MAQMLKIKAAGGIDFPIEVAATGATVQDVKIAATAGCDMDPEVMKVIYKGKVLKDEDTLASCGIQTGDTLHVAKGMSRPAPQPSENQSSGYSGASGSGKATFEICFKGPSGVEVRSDQFGETDTVEQLRQFASSEFATNSDEVHLLHKGKILKDGASLGSCGVAAGSVLRVARRHNEKDAASDNTVQPTEVPEVVGSPMPMAWGANSQGELEQIRTMARTLGLPLEPLEQVLREVPPQQAMTAAMQEIARLRRGPPAGETAAEMQARWDREAADMARQVRAYLSRREEGEEQEGDGDEELLADISRTLAEARARGAPVPNAAVFVDRTVARRRQARELHARMAREASGLDPEIEDAFAAAEQSLAASARAPRRLGGEPRRTE
ncbi:ubqln [Symbiodinium microadriaticum]|nr:ubqln [Symbiodinium sp. KB8]CAE7820329.1 ubqln [Symbiodinium microadriaticum]